MHAASTVSAPTSSTRLLYQPKHIEVQRDLDCNPHPSSWPGSHHCCESYRWNGVSNNGTPLALGTTSDSRGWNRSRYAYAAMIAGVGVKGSHSGYVYNVAIAARRLRRFGSTADFVAMVIIADGEPLAALPEKDARVLSVSGVSVRYTKTLIGPLNFASTVAAKFYSWQLTMYDAVQFLDADVMPMRNMDALFSFPSFAACPGRVSPLNSGYLMARPSCDIFADLLDLHALKYHGDINWNMSVGWGVRRMAWRNVFNRERADWNFHGAQHEQGLLWYYFRFVRREMHIINLASTTRVSSRRARGDQSHEARIAYSFKCCSERCH